MWGKWVNVGKYGVMWENEVMWGKWVNVGKYGVMWENMG
jgi:hypothetical protein